MPNGSDDKLPKESAAVTGLATTGTSQAGAALGDYILRLLHIRRGIAKNVYNVDAVRTNSHTLDVFRCRVDSFIGCDSTKYLGRR